jgi:hypothetical protein
MTKDDPFGESGQTSGESTATNPREAEGVSKKAASPSLPAPHEAPDVEIEVDFSTTRGVMADLSGVNRGVYTEGRYGTPDTSIHPADYTRLYQAIGVTSVRTHGDCFDVASIFGLKRAAEEDAVGDLPITHSIELMEYIDNLGIPIVNDASAIQGVQLQMKEAWLDFFDTQDRRLIWGEKPLSDFTHHVALNFPDYTDALNSLNNASSNAVPSWLYWFPSSDGALLDSANFRFAQTGAEDAYRALIDGGFEVYFRVGESMAGPTYTSERLLDGDIGTFTEQKARYAEAAKMLLFHLAPTAHPGFVEIWNEPDGSFFTGQFKGDVQDFGTDFVGQYAEIEDRLRNAVEIDHAPIGGSGFTRDGMNYLVHSGENSSVGRILLQAGPSLFDFVSFHWYSRAEDEWWGPQRPMDVQPFLNRVLHFATDLEAFIEALQSFYSGPWDLDPGEYPPIHVSEWNIQLPADAGSANTEKNFCVGTECAPFVAAAMTWMQARGQDESEARIQRAHFFAGHDQDSGLFHFENAHYYSDVLEEDGVALPDSLAIVGTEDVTVLPAPAEMTPTIPDDGSPGPAAEFHGVRTEPELVFKVRPSALAMSLFAGSAGQEWNPVLLRTQVDGIEHSHDDMLTAAAAGVDVAAVAYTGSDVVTGETVHTVILTNLSDATRRVNLRLRGFGFMELDVEKRSVRTDLRHGGLTIRRAFVERWQATPGSAWRYRPVEGMAGIAITTGMHIENIGPLGVIPHASALSEFGVELPGHGVVRLQLRHAS